MLFCKTNLFPSDNLCGDKLGMSFALQIKFCHFRRRSILIAAGNFFFENANFAFIKVGFLPN